MTRPKYFGEKKVRLKLPFEANYSPLPGYPEGERLVAYPGPGSILRPTLNYQNTAFGQIRPPTIRKS